MKRKMFSIFDVKAGMFIDVVMYPTVSEMIRSFTDLVNRSGTLFNLHPEDYMLFEFAEYEDQHSVIVDSFEPKFVARAVDYHEKLKDEYFEKVIFTPDTFSYRHSYSRTIFTPNVGKFSD